MRQNVIFMKSQTEEEKVETVWLKKPQTYFFFKLNKLWGKYLQDKF